MEMLLRNKTPCLIDSRGKAISDYVIEKNNVLGTSLLFDFINKGDMNLEMATLIYGLKRDPLWISDHSREKMFVTANFKDGIKSTILGEIHNNAQMCIYTSLSNFVSMNMLKEHIKLDTNEKQEIIIKVSSIPFNLESGSKASLELLE